MVVLPFRAQRYVISLAGSLFFLPVYLFWGGVFSFSFTAIDSFWDWGFGLAACWSQILAILASFFNPRKAAYWMFMNTAIGILLIAGHVTYSANSHPLSPGPIENWLQAGSGLFKTAMIFWAPPLLIASLLLRRDPDQKNALIEPSANA